MAIRLPSPNFSSAPQPRRRSVPTEAILSVMGNNPYAKAIDQITPLLSQALLRRAETQRMARQTSALEGLAGEPKGSYKDLNPSVAASMASSRIEMQEKMKLLNDKKSKEQGQIRLLEEQGGFKPGELGDNYETAKTIFTQNETKKRVFENPNIDIRIGKERDDFITKFNKDPNVVKRVGQREFGNDLRVLVTSGNPIAANSIPTFMARASGEVGNLSEADKRPFGGSQAILERTRAALKQAASGNLTESNAGFLLEMASLFQENAEKAMNNVAFERANQVSRGSGIYKSPMEAFEALRPGYSYEEMAATKRLPPIGKKSPSKLSGETPQQRKARLLKELEGAK